MEDVLDLSAEPYDARRPSVCFDERPCQLSSDTRTPLPPKPGQPQRVDYAYKREGTCHLFRTFQPLGGWRKVQVTERRPTQDFAHWMNALVDEDFPEAEVIRVALDTLNTHSPARLYAAFAPAAARRLTRKLEFQHTPKHGSWLNMAEGERAVLSDQWLDRRIPARETMQREVTAWEQARNAQKATVPWRFTTPEARAKLKRLSPS